MSEQIYSFFLNENENKLAFSSCIFFQENIHGSGDRRIFLRRSFHVKGKPLGFDGGSSTFSQRPKSHLSLLKIREIVFQRLNTERTKENNHIVFANFNFFYQIGGHRLKYNCLCIFNMMLGKKIGILCSQRICPTGNEIFVVRIFQKQIKNTLRIIVLIVENFAFSELNVFLKIKSGCICRTKIIHLLRNINSHLFYQIKKIINGIFARENNSCVV